MRYLLLFLFTYNLFAYTVSTNNIPTSKGTITLLCPNNGYSSEDTVTPINDCSVAIPDGYVFIEGTARITESNSFTLVQDNCAGLDGDFGHYHMEWFQIRNQLCNIRCEIPILPNYVLTGVDCNEVPPVGKYTATMCGCPYNEAGDAHLYGLPNPDYTPACDLDCDALLSEAETACHATRGILQFQCDDSENVCTHDSNCSAKEPETPDKCKSQVASYVIPKTRAFHEDILVLPLP